MVVPLCVAIVSPVALLEKKPWKSTTAQGTAMQRPVFITVSAPTSAKRRGFAKVAPLEVETPYLVIQGGIRTQTTPNQKPTR
jgi:hypothetical protein